MIDWKSLAVMSVCVVTFSVCLLAAGFDYLGWLPPVVFGAAWQTVWPVIK